MFPNAGLVLSFSSLERPHTFHRHSDTGCPSENQRIGEMTCRVAGPLSWAASLPASDMGVCQPPPSSGAGRMVHKAEHYPWSSGAPHCGLRSDQLPSPFPGIVPVRTEDWSTWLAEKDDEMRRCWLQSDFASVPDARLETKSLLPSWNLACADGCNPDP